MKELKDSGLIAIEVPDISYNHYVEVDMDGLTWYIGFLFKDENGQVDGDHIIINGNYDVVGWCTADDISFDPEPFIEKEKESQESAIIYKDYVGQYWGHSKKESSFRSLLTANGVLFVNPYGEKPSYSDFQPVVVNRFNATCFSDAMRQWQQAESQLVKKVLILKPINK